MTPSTHDEAIIAALHLLLGDRTDVDKKRLFGEAFGYAIIPRADAVIVKEYLSLAREKLEAHGAHSYELKGVLSALRTAQGMTALNI